MLTFNRLQNFQQCEVLYSLLQVLVFFSQGKWDVPLPKVKAIGEDEVFRVVKTGKSKRMFSGFFPINFCVHPIM